MLSIWFHDIVYDPKAPKSQNEVLSDKEFKKWSEEA